MSGSKIAMLVLLLALMPSVSGEFIVSEYNVTYELGDADYIVTESMRVKSLNPLSHEDFLTLKRGDAREVEAAASIKEISFRAIYDYPTTISIDLRKVPILKEMTLALRYRRSEGLGAKGTARIFSFSDLGRYPFDSFDECIRNFNDCKYKAVITIVGPDGKQFGKISPVASVEGKGTVAEKLVYRMTLLENITEARDGLAFSVEYANYRGMAMDELATAETLLDQIVLVLAEANASIRNAETYSLDLGQVNALYNESSTLYKNALLKHGSAQSFLNPPANEYYRAYLLSAESGVLARESYTKANDAKNLANFLIQRSLEREIAKLGKSLQQQHEARADLNKALAENFTRALEEMERKRAEIEVPSAPQAVVQAPGRNYYAVAFFLLLGSIVIYGAASAVLYARRTKLKERGSVSQFRVIEDLKKKTFVGFERKVDTVKHEVALAARIRELRSTGEKFSLGIENLKKKKLDDEISQAAYESEKKKFEDQLAQINAEVEELEEQLKALKKGERR